MIPGLGIWSSVFWANHSFLWAHEKEQIVHGCSFVKSNGSDGWKSEGSDSLLGLKKGEKHMKNMFFLLRKLLVFLEQFERITSEPLSSLFFKEIDSNLLTGALLERDSLMVGHIKEQRERFSHVFILKERRKRIAHSCSLIWANLSKRANSQPCTILMNYSSMKYFKRLGLLFWLI